MWDQEAQRISVCDYLILKYRYKTPTNTWMAGWDPIFEYQGKTYAEMDKEAKVKLKKILTPSLYLCRDMLTFRAEQNLPPIQGLGEIAAMASRGKYLIY